MAKRQDPWVSETWREDVIEHIRSGKPVRDSCKLVKVSLSKFYADRQQDPDFQAAVMQAMGRRRRFAPPQARKISLSEKELTHDWKHQFLLAFQELGPKATIAAACRLLNQQGIEISPSTIYARFNEKHSKFDERFRDQFLELEANPVAEIEHTHLSMMRDGKIPAQAQRYLENHPVSRLRYRAPERLQIERTSVSRTETVQKVEIRILQEHRHLLGKERALLKGESHEADTDHRQVDADDGEDRAIEAEAVLLAEEEEEAEARMIS